jgi:hypothetical protein
MAGERFHTPPPPQEPSPISSADLRPVGRDVAARLGRFLLDFEATLEVAAIPPPPL